MITELALRNINELLRDWNARGSSALPYGNIRSFEKLGMFEGPRDNDLFIGGGRHNQLVANKLRACHGRASGVPVGIVEMNDVHVLLPYGLILDFTNGVCWHGSLIGWTTRAVGHKLAANLSTDGSRLLVDVDAADFSEAANIDSCCLFTGAGFDIYGHWLGDYIPRLVSARRFVEDKAVTFAMRPRASWAQAMIELLMPGQLDRFLPEAQGLYRVRRLLVPSSVRYENSIEPKRARECWNTFAQCFGSTQGPERLPRRMFVSRQGWRRTRKFSRMLPNIEEIENCFEAAGFEIVSPEAFSLAEQKQLFANAAVVAGEDGSGLHNTIFSPPGTVVVVITSGRLNTLHAEIAGALGHRIVYVGPPGPHRPKAEPGIVPLGEINRVIADLKGFR